MFLYKEVQRSTELDRITQATKIISFQELSVYSRQKGNRSPKWHIPKPATEEVLRTSSLLISALFCSPLFFSGFSTNKEDNVRNCQFKTGVCQ